MSSMLPARMKQNLDPTGKPKFIIQLSTDNSPTQDLQSKVPVMRKPFDLFVFFRRGRRYQRDLCVTFSTEWRLANANRVAGLYDDGTGIPIIAKIEFIVVSPYKIKTIVVGIYSRTRSCLKPW